MKRNLVDKDVEEMSFNRLTLVLNDPESARKFAPVNPEAVLLAVKASEDKGPIAHLLAALKSALLGDDFTPSRKDDDGDSTEDSSVPDQAASKQASPAAPQGSPPADNPAAPDPGAAAVTNAKNAGVTSALFNHTAQLHDNLANIHHNATMPDADKKKAMADAIADHATKTTALAAAMYAKKADDIMAELERKSAERHADATKAGARHSKADLADLQAAHDHLESTHASLTDSLAKVADAKAHTGRMLGKPGPNPACEGDDDPDDDEPADNGAGASKAQTTSEEDEMTTEEMTAAVAAGVREAFKAQAKPEPALDTTALAATIVDAVKADITALDTKIDALEANIKIKVDEATKAAQDAAKPELDRLTEAAANAEATAALATKAAADANALVKNAIKSSRDREAAGGHETALESANKAKQQTPVAERLKAIGDGPQKHTERIAALLAPSNT